MRHDRGKGVFSHERYEPRRVCAVEGFRRATARVAREELERIRPNGEGLFPHMVKAF